MTGKTTSALIALILIAIWCPAARPGDSAKEVKPGPGDAAPLFSTEALDGRPVSLKDLTASRKVVLLNFWGLRCSSCIDEIGYLNPMADRYGEKGVVFLGVNVDGVKADTIQKLMPGMPHSPRFVVLPDPGFKIPDLYNMTAAPLSFVIGKDGRIVFRHEDFKPGDEKDIEEALKKAIAD